MVKIYSCTLEIILITNRLKVLKFKKFKIVINYNHNGLAFQKEGAQIYSLQ